ncbi:MAG: hypothetical protein ACYS8I_06745 [Planctomycetota bacterium]|jgi:hypothetical protein
MRSIYGVIEMAKKSRVFETTFVDGVRFTWPDVRNGDEDMVFQVGGEVRILGGGDQFLFAEWVLENLMLDEK